MTLALIAHDGKKDEMAIFAREHREILARFQLVGTGTTARIVSEASGLDVRAFLSGPLGGDVQIAAELLAGGIHAVLFFVEPRDVHPHDPDIQTLLRICNLTDTPLATNPKSSRYLLLGIAQD
ncbi:methylglyoxal synthase [bacterium]|nr:MAG: methylglyoxal synthase [bacterium]